MRAGLEGLFTARCAENSSHNLRSTNGRCAAAGLVIGASRRGVWRFDEGVGGSPFLLADH
jgi:hypothetical protein